MDTPGAGTHQTSLGERCPSLLQKHTDLMLSASISAFSSFQSATQASPLPFFLPSKASAFLVSACQPRLTHSLAWAPCCSCRVPSHACCLGANPPPKLLAVDDSQDYRSSARPWWLMSRYFAKSNHFQGLSQYSVSSFSQIGLISASRRGMWSQYRIMSKKHELRLRVHVECDVNCAAWRKIPTLQSPWTISRAFAQACAILQPAWLWKNQFISQRLGFIIYKTELI